MARLLSQVRKAVDETAATARQLRDGVNSAEGRLVDMRTWVQASLVPCVSVPRARGCGCTVGTDQGIAHAKEQLTASAEAYARAHFIPSRLLVFRDSLRKREEELPMCEAEYQARVAPWKRGMGMLPKNNVHAGGEAER